VLAPTPAEQELSRGAASVVGRASFVVFAAGGALVGFVLLTLYLVGHDGGRPLPTLAWTVGIATVCLLPSLVFELRRLAVFPLMVVAGVITGPSLSWSAAPFRAGGARPMLVAVATGLAFVAVRHLWRSEWGQMAVGGVVAATLLRAWYGAFLAWWGSGMGGGRPQWLALSWHNQSGTLMAAGAVAALAVAILGPARLRLAVAVFGGALAAATWLSGSRGAVLVAILGAAVVLALPPETRLAGRSLRRSPGPRSPPSWRSSPWERSSRTDHRPLADRDQAAEQNLRMRVGHAEAAVRMALEEPLTGTGPGSYRWASLPVYPEDTNLTSSAHNEYLEAFGETGILGGLPVAVAALAGAWLVLTQLTRRRALANSSASDHRGAGVVAACGVVTVLGVHAGADFDWDYALLPVLLAAGIAILSAERPSAREAPRWMAAGAGAMIVGAAGLAVTVGLLGVGSAPPWQLDVHSVQTAIAEDDPATAPGSPRRLSTAPDGPAEQEVQVGAERPVLDVEQVHADRLVERHVGAA
jgi:hypothetical protein